MPQDIYEVKRERFHLTDPSVYILQGKWPKDFELEAALDGKKVDGALERWENTSALERFADLDMKRGMRGTVTLRLPSDWREGKSLTVTAVSGAERIRWFSISVRDLKKRCVYPCFYIEEENVIREDQICSVRGWAAAKERVDLEVRDAAGKKIPATVEWNQRVDVEELFQETSIWPKCGFYVEIHSVTTPVVYLVFRAGKKYSSYPVDQRRAYILKKRMEGYARKGVRYLKSHGAAALLTKAAGKLRLKRREPIPYGRWLSKHLPAAAELNAQRETVFERMPKISIVVPLYRTPEKFLRELVDSVRNQTYANWELCLSDGSGADSPLDALLGELQAQDARIRVVRHEKPLKIAENTNEAIRIATGDLIAFMDHDDALLPHALYECAKAVNERPETKLIYSDEDKMSADGHKFFQPHFKPDLNIDLMRTVNYICHLFVADRGVLFQAGLLREEFDGAQDYDLIFRCLERVSRQEVYHIPKILYHWRFHEGSTAENPESKTYAFDAGQRAIQAHYERLGIPAEVFQGEYPGLYRTKYHWESKPLISILIPNKDHVADLKRCMDSIDQRSTYRNYEYIIVENNSGKEETFAFYKELEQAGGKARVVYWDGPFNYSAINNFGEKYANGEYLLLLNNDTELISPDGLEEMLGYCMRDDVGAVGARLYYEDDTVQHAGVVIGFGGIAGHCFVQQPRGATGYCHRIICAQDYSAVTAACMMVKREAFHKVGGLSEKLAVAFNDVDFCLKLGRAGYLVVYNPYAELYHYESKSRGLEDTPEKVARFNREIQIMEESWPDIFRDGDPYYNPNLTLDSQDFSLKRI